MSIRVALTHRTSYAYDRKIGLGPQIVRLRPAPHTRTPIVSYSQRIVPAGHFLNWQQDPFGNWEARAVFPDRTDRFEVIVDLVADMEAINPFDFFLEDAAFHAPFAYPEQLAADLAPYLEADAAGDRFEALVAETRTAWEAAPDEQETITFLVELNQRVRDLVGYVVRLEPGVQTPEQTLQSAKGSCRDSAWLLVNLLRRIGIAARFVSGYLIQLAPDDPADGGPAEDFTDLHAWAEAYLPGAGWVGMDATSGLFAGEGHIPLAATPSPSSAAPISGGLDEAEVTFDFEMSVRRLREPARNTKPFTDGQWAQVEAAAAHVEHLLQAGDVRLTQGGEPTFVAAADRDAEEWTTGAVGPTKRGYADALVRRLMARFAPGGLLTHGQGKWYPGEPLPRWAFSVLWRADGQDLWSDPALIADEDGAGTPDAAAFGQALARTLGLEPEMAQPVYEDPARYVLEEADLPTNVTPEDNRLDDPVDRARLARVFARGLGAPAGMVLPLQQQQDRHDDRVVRWQSEIWKTRRGRLFAVPGDSPLGFRLPLKALPHLDEAERPQTYEPDPWPPRGDLPPVQILRQVHGRAAEAQTRTPQRPATPVRTALAIEPRDGHLAVFLPPTESAEAYLDLIAAVEAVAVAQAQPVRIEGYPPPSDPRFREIKVTPDPGVIEVNTQPAADWGELRAITEGLYADAAAVGLDASGFALDGRPTGSGGGAHVVVGGATPEDSPFLRRPDVLASLVRVWNAHPALSYMFAGQFIGPTSQAPRPDEGRHDQLIELDLALKQIPGAGTDVPPWLVDRILRHLLVDATGNTHRAEICIDKLFSPDGPAGRLGLVEFRAFEMPPHWQMNMAQQLLLRAILAWVWAAPRTGPLVDHGPALHDRYILPDVLWADLCALLRAVSDGIGVEIDPEWFRAQYDFRFPRAGLIEVDGVTLELRNALEPWHVLGEEGTPGGTARFVDSSLERLQVKVTGADPDRHLIACQGRRLPLQPVGGAMVAGVRFRSWLPASALHPTMPATPDLTFDLVDRSAGRAIAGATYHAQHPGGRNFERRPVNPLEAEGRRRIRFAARGHRAGTFAEVPGFVDPRQPFTLDLRR
ncbi:MAG: transglutaminase family protein [Shimia sp.]